MKQLPPSEWPGQGVLSLPGHTPHSWEENSTLCPARPAPGVAARTPSDLHVQPVPCYLTQWVAACL